jgi:hypothetical protein
MAVVDAAHGMKVAPDHVYVIQPNTNVAIADGVLSVTPRPDELPPEAIARRLASLPQHPYLALPAEPAGDHVDSPDDFQRVIAALRTSSGVDFTQYRDTTIKRRTARRMLLRGLTSAHRLRSLPRARP